jgi:hypothetical protein
LSPVFVPGRSGDARQMRTVRPIAFADCTYRAER